MCTLPLFQLRYLLLNNLEKEESKVYHCDDYYKSGHVCPKQQLFIVDTTLQEEHGEILEDHLEEGPNSSVDSDMKFHFILSEDMSVGKQLESQEFLKNMLFLFWLIQTVLIVFLIVS